MEENQECKDVFILHGWGGSKESLKDLAAQLKNMGYRVQKLEMPGHGNTPPMNFPWGMEDFVQWLSQKVQNSYKYILIGHSFGGKIIIAATASKVVNPCRIVLIDSSGIKPRNSFKKFAWKIMSTLANPMLKVLPAGFIKKYVYKYLVKETDYSKLSGVMQYTFQNIVNTHYDDKLKDIKIKTLIMWGKNDKQTPLWMAEKIKQKIPHSELVVMDSTHGLPKREPVKVAKYILDWLRND